MKALIYSGCSWHLQAAWYLIVLLTAQPIQFSLPNHILNSFHVQKHEGYPSGSVVDFACDADGSLILAVSSLAIHTKVCALLIHISTLKDCKVYNWILPSRWIYEVSFSWDSWYITYTVKIETIFVPSPAKILNKFIDNT